MKAGLTQALGVFVDTIVICSCTAMIMLLVPEKLVAGKEGMDLLQTAMRYHLGEFGVIFIAVTLFLFSFLHFWEFSFMQDVMWHICLVTNGAGRLHTKYWHL